MNLRNVFLASLVSVLATVAAAAGEPIRIAVFEADVTPPLGTPLCDALVAPAKKIVDPLKARGIILLSSDQPSVLCAVDWVGIGNGGHTAFREALAAVVGTTKERVCVQCLHQHDAPGCDFTADELLAPYGLGGKLFDPAFARSAIARIADAAKEAVKNPRTVTHIGIGKAKVENVASNRRVLGPDGKVKYVRFSATKDAEIRAEPEGLIDPYVQLLAFFDGETTIAALSYYATHPQSYYGKGDVSCDFPGLARGLRDRAAPGAMHVHFNGAGGNVTAGKYNDGSPENRPVLAERLAKGMEEAFPNAKREPIDSDKVSWRHERVAMPASLQCQSAYHRARVADPKLKESELLRSARDFVWAKRCEQGDALTPTPENSVPATDMKINSRILAPTAGATLPADAPVTLKGVAWNEGAATITSVELSIDGGRTWHGATLAAETSPFAFREWSHPCVPPAGRRELWSRAVDAFGRTQPIDGAIFWNPGGYCWNGVDKVAVTAR